MTLDYSWHLHNNTLISLLPTHYLTLISKLLIEISAGKVVSTAWEPLDYGENGWDGPENLVAGSSPPQHAGPVGGGDLRVNLHLDFGLGQVIKRSEKML